MKDYQTRITKLLPPPSKPSCTDGDWTEVERKLGIPLPEDYQWFVSNYGIGEIGTIGSSEGYLYVLSPFSTYDGLNLYQGIELALTNLRRYCQDGTVKKPKPYPLLFPETGGLLPFGGTANCNYLSWRTVGPPNQWHVVVWDMDCLQLRELLGSTLSKFLIDTLTNKAIIADNESLTGEGWLDEPTFLPFRPAEH